MHLLLLVIIRIVGEDDGGELFTPEQYEEYKKKVLPMVRTNKQTIKTSKKTKLYFLIYHNKNKYKKKPKITTTNKQGNSRKYLDSIYT